ncbi:hypothetical protein BFR57_04175 [Idiomarina sp. MD25a]|nr:hypothetical protein BFR57_04175 [Idiomarina sp. MD25a]
MLAQQHDIEAESKPNVTQQWQAELQAYQDWQAAMEHKKRELALAELQLNWLKKQVEIAHQQRLLQPTVRKKGVEPSNCIRVANHDWQLQRDATHWYWGSLIDAEHDSQRRCF